eukprot:SM000165S02202  [mRNA]  locus=s165:113664:116728:- [translate_table: standard]
MSRMSPDDLRRMQQMMTPEVLQAAQASMRSMSPADMQAATERMGSSGFSMEDAQAKLAGLQQQQGPRSQYSAALGLKDEGNRLHRQGKYADAADKYKQAKAAAASISSAESSSLRQTCSVNLMSCYLKLNKYTDAIAEGSEVLQDDESNLKALYRRGQARKELGRLKAAVADLSRAADLAPDDETIGETLRQAREDLAAKVLTGEEDEEEDEVEEVVNQAPKVASIDELDDGEVEDERSVAAGPDSSSLDNGVGVPSPLAGGSLGSEFVASRLAELKQNPNMLSNMQSVMANLAPEQIASMTGGAMTPEMAAAAAQMMKNLSPDDLSRMLEMSQALQGQGIVPPRPPAAAAATTSGRSARPRGGPSISSSGHAAALEPRSEQAAEVAEAADLVGAMPDAAAAGSRSAERMPSSMAIPPGMAMPPGMMMSEDMQQTLRQQMRNPEMMKMMSEMMKGMSAESMAAMSEQMGMKMTKEQAGQAQQILQGLSPKQMEKVMLWADRAQRAAEVGRKAKEWLLGRWGLVLAVCMVLLAILLHYLGYIG